MSQAIFGIVADFNAADVSAYHMDVSLPLLLSIFSNGHVNKDRFLECIEKEYPGLVVCPDREYWSPWNWQHCEPKGDLYWASVSDVPAIAKDMHHTCLVRPDERLVSWTHLRMYGGYYRRAHANSKGAKAVTFLPVIAGGGMSGSIGELSNGYNYDTAEALAHTVRCRAHVRCLAELGYKCCTHTGDNDEPKEPR